MPHKVSIN